MHTKSESFEMFKEFKPEFKGQLGKPLKSLRSNRGGKYLSIKFKSFLTNHGIVSQFTTSYTPQQNSVAERINRILLNMVHSMISYSSLSISFWGYAT